MRMVELQGLQDISFLLKAVKRGKLSTATDTEDSSVNPASGSTEIKVVVKVVV